MAQLPWLPTHPDLGDAIRAAKSRDQKEDRLGDIIALSRHDRDAFETNRIARMLDCQPEPALLHEKGLASVRLAMLGSHTLDHLVPAIRVASLNHGVCAEVRVGRYGMYREDVLGSNPELEQFAPQIVMLCLDISAIIPDLVIGSDEQAVTAAVDDALAALRQLWATVRSRQGAHVLQQSFIEQEPRLAGSNEWLLPASRASICRRLNEGLQHAARDGEVLLLDLDHVGSAGALYDPARWHQGKQLVNPLFAPLYGDHVARILGALNGKSRRCLVLDLDNTLWGGVIGDCGVEGIVLGQGNAGGEAFLAVQRYAAMLRERGIILAVCSKNDPEVARAAFDRHPEMRIAFEDVACFVANWSDKATNLRAIAATVNLGLDTLVFVDDNPAERAIIRRELPQVAVPELPDDVALYPGRIAAAGYFEAVAITSEDLMRAHDYRATQLRSQALQSITDMEGYLSSLDMRLTGGAITPLDLARSAQLINKSNQFNLTTRRRSEAELAELAARPDSIALAFRLRDRFGDSGLISVVLARPDPGLQPGELLIDTWLMSCRVLGRGVEQAALEVLCEAARSRGASALVGQFIPSGRNEMVREHYAKLGFQRATGAVQAEGQFWRLKLDRQQPCPHHLALEIIL